MDLETTGGEAMARLQELLPALDRGEQACEEVSGSLARARTEVSAHFEELAAAADALREGLLEQRAARAPAIAAERDAVDDLLAVAEEYRRGCQKEMRESGLPEAAEHVKRHRDAQSERQREVSARLATLLSDARHRRERLQERIDAVPDAIRDATEQVAAFRDRVAARAEEMRAFVLEQCLPRLESQMAAFGERLADLQDQAAEALRVGGETVAETADQAMAAGMEAFEAMSARIEGGTRLWEQSLASLAGATVAVSGAVERRQDDWSAQTAQIGQLFEEAGVAFGEALEGLSRLAVVPIGSFGAAPLPFPVLPR